MRSTTHPTQSSCSNRAGHSVSPHRGYTLIELLVVISIMIVSLSIIIPSINQFIELTTDNTAKNGFNTALTAIRAYATRDVGSRNSAASSTYSGVAIIVTPACELRLTENDQFAQDVSSGTGHEYLENNSTYGNLNAYIDLDDREYITIPKDTGIVGILSPTGNTKYISPPFAIRFDEKGQLAVTDTSTQQNDTYVYYDGNYDGYLTLNLSNDGSSRTKPFDGFDQYKVQQWDRNEQAYFDLLSGTPEKNTTTNKPGIYAPSNQDDANYGKNKLPFEKLEAVIGVVIYSKRTLWEDTQGNLWPGTSNGTAWPTPNTGCGRQHDQNCSDFEEWLQDNGEVLFFSRYTGALLQHK